MQVMGCYKIETALFKNILTCWWYKGSFCSWEDTVWGYLDSASSSADIFCSFSKKKSPDTFTFWQLIFNSAPYQLTVSY